MLTDPSNVSEVRPETARLRSPARWLAAAAASICVLGGAISAPAFAPPEGTVASGVVVAEVPLGGASEADARARLEELGRSLEHRELRLVAQPKETIVSLAQLGVQLDVEATLERVMTVAREGGFAGASRAFLRTRTDVPFVFTLDEGAFNEIVPSIEEVLVDDPPFDGAIHVEDGVPRGELPRTGHRIERQELEQAIRANVALTGQSSITVPLQTIVPPLTEADVQLKVEEAKVILSGPITLWYAPPEELVAQLRKENEEAEKRFKDEADRAKWKMPKRKSRMKRKGKRLVEETTKAKPDTLPLPESVELQFTQQDLLLAFRAHRVDVPSPRFIVELDEAEVKRKLAPVVPKLYNAARDARFDIDAQNRITIQKSRPGTRVDHSRLVEALYKAALTPDRRGPLPVDNNAEPQFTTTAAEALAIKGLVSEFTTHHACCQARVKNIHRICDMLNGTIVKAGDTMSVNSMVGPRTLERGFLMAPSIGDGEMTETPGGGVSQFATTLYNALFDGGYVVRQRQAHSFYFSRYPMGIEATLSYPSPDLVFMNDTKAALLLRCDYGETFIRVRLFGDNGGRRVDREVSRPFSYTDPRVEYVGKRSRDPDDDKVKDHGSHGFSVVTSRRITEADGTSRVEKRTIKYVGKPKLIEVHPCRIPKHEKGYTGERCPKPEELEDPPAP